MLKGKIRKIDITRLKAAQDRLVSLLSPIFAPWSQWCTCGEGHDIHPDEIEWHPVGNTVYAVHTVCGKYWWTPPAL